MRKIKNISIIVVLALMFTGCVSQKKISLQKELDSRFSATVKKLETNYLPEWKGPPGTGLELILYYNNSVRKSELPENCMVILEAPLDERTREILNTPLTSEFVPENYDVEMKFHKNGYRSFKTMSLLDFLRLLSSTYAMNVLYTENHIKIGYGFTGDYRIF